MDSYTGTLKYYNSDAFKQDQFIETFFSATVDKAILQELTVKPMEKLHQVFSSGHIGGDTLIDICAGPTLFQLFPVCKFFKEITILKYNDQCINELRKWMNNDPDAHDWHYASKICIQLEDTSETFQDREDMLRNKSKYIGKCNLANANPTWPIELPKASCVLSSRALDSVSEDCSTFLRNLKNMSSLLQVGGYLILFADINTSFFRLGDDKYYVFNYNEDFLRKALKDVGYIIICYEIIQQDTESKLYNMEKTVFVVAQKQ
ncbi:nicotinamide N-methyltransferase-like [Mixophyes fleayi]|uniref:nicotinamide N-methyltransferase-like n=1 Tax=Mixophyes fleayi TaxID=3061075 RepID=UPI003F4DCCB2